MEKTDQITALPVVAPAPTIIQTRQSAGVWIINLTGDITKLADQEIQEAYRQIPNWVKSFAMNFSHCDYINSAGIAVIVSLITQARRKGQRVMVYGLSSHYHKLFYMVGLSDYVEIYDDESDLMAKAGALPPASRSP